MVRDNQLDQYFQLVKDMLLEEVISEPLIHTSQSNLAYDSGFGQSNAGMNST